VAVENSRVKEMPELSKIAAVKEGGIDTDTFSPITISENVSLLLRMNSVAEYPSNEMEAT
jgi:hypothetical protein